MGTYTLRCVKCDTAHGQYSTRCGMDDSLLRSEYASRTLNPRPLPGIWKFSDWLPVQGTIPEVRGGPMVYRSESLARGLGLEDLFIAYNGYWPEREALLSTCSFKDLEAAPTVQRLMERGNGDVLVVASAGNTARAFAQVCSLTGQPLVLVVPRTALHKLWLPGEGERTGSIFVVAVDGDYSDAISVGDELSNYPGFVPEGGARNIARRDGMGTVMLEAALTVNVLPRHYFQAVGSGTGGIAAWEAALRLIGDGRFGRTIPILHLSQNLPCAPLLSALHGDTIAPSCPAGMFDEVLFNRRPPLNIPGGVADALRATGGSINGITNEQAQRARELFEEAEGIDILPAAAVAVADLMLSVSSGQVRPDETILLNITGGGEKRLRQDVPISNLESDLNVPRSGYDIGEIARQTVESVTGM